MISLEREGNLVEFTRSPENQRERFHYITTWTGRLFPKAEGTPAPFLVNKLLNEIAPLCSDIYGRGSFFLRTELCPNRPYAPPGYWELPRLFSWFSLPSRANNNSPLVQAAALHNAEGPDVDIMVKKAAGVSDEDIYKTVNNWAVRNTDKRFIRNSYTYIEVNRVVFADWNGPEDPRVYTTALISRRKKYYSGDPDWVEPIVRVDVGETPNAYLQSLDARLSWGMTFKDMLSLTRFKRRRNGFWVYGMDQSDYDSLVYLSNGVMAKISSAAIRRTVANRYIFQEIIYASESIGHWLTRQLNARNSFPTEYFDDTKTADIPVLERRRTSIIGDTMLGAGADRWKWLVYGNTIGLFKDTYLGEILTDELFFELVYMGYKHIERDASRFWVECNLMTCIERLSEEYRQWLASGTLPPNNFGPIALVRDLNQIQGIKREPSLNQFADLTDPVLFLQKKARQAERKYSTFVWE